MKTVAKYITDHLDDFKNGKLKRPGRSDKDKNALYMWFFRNKENDEQKTKLFEEITSSGEFKLTRQNFDENTSKMFVFNKKATLTEALNKVVRYIEENWCAFMEGELHLPSQCKYRQVYMWLYKNKENEEQKNKLFKKLSVKFELIREVFNVKLNKMIVFRENSTSKQLFDISYMPNSQEAPDTLTLFTISQFSKPICDNSLGEFLKKYEAPSTYIWMVNECQACLYPSTVKAIYDNHLQFYILEEYENFLELRQGEHISRDIECKFQFGNQTVKEFCKQYGIPKDEIKEVLRNCLLGGGPIHGVYIEKTHTSPT